MQKIIKISSVILILFIFCFSKENAFAMANPASVNCNNLGGTSVIRTDSKGGQYGMCVFPDGKECEEWNLFLKKICVEYNEKGK